MTKWNFMLIELSMKKFLQPRGLASVVIVPAPLITCHLLWCFIVKGERNISCKYILE